jgi:glycolate oxidase
MNNHAFLKKLGEIFPENRLLTKTGQLVTYESDSLTSYQVRPLAVVLPEDQGEVVETVKTCNEFNIPFVARGSGTSLSGGSLPIAGGIVIALNRLNKIIRVDPKNRIAVVEAGVVNIDISQAAAPHGLYFAPDPSSQLICTIGGNLAFNSGGAHCLKYGMTSNHILAIKAVLPDGEIVELGSESLENTGPDLVGMYVGSEGLFGIALEITVRLLPKPEAYQTVLAAYDSIEAAGEAVSMVIAAGLLPGAIEIMDNLAIQAAETAVQAGYPRDAAGLLIVELDGEELIVDAEFKALMEIMEESGASEIRIAEDDEQRAMIWKGRKSAFSAVGRISQDYLVQDGVVPRSQLSKALGEISKLSTEYEIQVANVFHAGDGNLHPLILFDGRDADNLEKAELLAGKILRMCVDLGGSITGEHGIGVEKLKYVPVMFSDVDIEIMQAIRSQIDPSGLSNQGKMLPQASGS